jgi:hypothetical protein
MKLFLAFSGEGKTDYRFISTVIGRLIQEYFIQRGVTVEFSWITIPRKGSSHDNILSACTEAKDYHLVLFHRDSGSHSWNQAYQNHFISAMTVLNNDSKNQFNRNLVPVIPVSETEAWMLCNKTILKEKIETNLSDNDLQLTYKINNIETIADPKSVIEHAITKHHETLTPKQRRYAVKIDDLYDSIASDIPISDLNNLNAFIKLKESLNSMLNSII